MDQLTDRQRQILAFIRDYALEHGVTPSRTEIAQAMGFRAINTAQFHVRALARKGYIELVSQQSRNIRLLEALPDDGQGVPLVGRVAAGSPILAVANIEGYYHTGELFRPRADYLLRVYGMSMRDAGILDGDLIAVHKTPEARNGQIVVARLDDDVTVKRFERRKKTIRLLAENPDYAPIDINPARHTLTIEGICVGLVRARNL